MTKETPGGRSMAALMAPLTPVCNKCHCQKRFQGRRPAALSVFPRHALTLYTQSSVHAVKSHLNRLSYNIYAQACLFALGCTSSLTPERERDSCKVDKDVLKRPPGYLTLYFILGYIYC